MQKLQSQGVHHITLVGAGRQTSIDFWEGVLGMPFIFEQPNLDKASESHLYFDPGDGRLITVFTDESRAPMARRTPTDSGCVHHIAFAVSRVTFVQAVARLDERGIKHSGVKDRGFMDSIYFEDPLGLLIELASYRFEPPAGFTHADVLMQAHKAARRARRLRNSRSASRRRDPGACRTLPRDPVGGPGAKKSILTSSNQREEQMAKSATKGAKKPAGKAAEKPAAKPAAKAAKPAAKVSTKPAKAAAKSPKKSALKLSMLKPSVNNMSVRVFARAAGLDHSEIDAWGQTRSPEYMARNPAHLTPMIEDKGLPRGVLWESCAIMQYLANKHGLEKFYPRAPAKRAMVDSAMFYLMGTLYPYVARATYPALGFPQYAGEVGHSDAHPDKKSEAQKAAVAAIAEPLEVFHSFFRDGKPFIGGKSPSIADIRLAATLEFLAVIDYALPTWANEYMAAMEKKLGKAYAEPAGDVRGYIAHVKSQATA